MPLQLLNAVSTGTLQNMMSLSSAAGQRLVYRWLEAANMLHRRAFPITRL